MGNKQAEVLKTKRNFFDRAIQLIEVVGNKLPNPVLLFFLVWLFVLILSQLLNGISATDPSTGKVVMINGLLNKKDLTWMMKSMIKNYTSFSPLGVVLVMMIGLGVTTGSGLLNEAMKKNSSSSRKVAGVHPFVRRDLWKYCFRGSFGYYPCLGGGSLSCGP